MGAASAMNVGICESSEFMVSPLKAVLQRGLAPGMAQSSGKQWCRSTIRESGPVEALVLSISPPPSTISQNISCGPRRGRESRFRRFNDRRARVSAGQGHYDDEHAALVRHVAEGHVAAMHRDG